MHDMRISSHTFGHQVPEHKYEGDNFESAESPAGSQYDDNVASSKNNLLAQKDEEINILWNVISKLKHNTNQEPDVQNTTAAATELPKKKRQAMHSYGNQSSIMNINGGQNSMGNYSHNIG